MDPKALADDLVANAPGGKFGEPHMLEITGLRQLVGAYETDTETDAAVRAFQDRLEELTGYRAPERLPIDPPAPAPLSTPPPPASSPQDIARSIIGGSFSAPFDGSEERLEVLAQRAWGSLQGLIAEGLSQSWCAERIEEEKSALRQM